MARRNQLWRILQAAEEFLVEFDRYFGRPRWVVDHSGLNQRSVRYQLNQFQRQGYLDDQLYFQGTNRGLLALLRRPWDRFWRIIFYDVPEKNRPWRRLIERNLREWGFAPIQRSTWLSPLPLDQQLNQLVQDWQSRADLIVTKSEILNRDPKQLVAQFWPLQPWADQAQKLIRQWRSRSHLGAKDKQVFWSLITEHPLVPLDLLPLDWPLEPLVKLFVDRAGGR